MRVAPVVLASVLAVSAAFPARGADRAPESYVIFCNGQPVGSSVIRFRQDGDELVVETAVSARITAGFLTLFTYRHTGREIWRGNRLMALDTHTDDNGDRMAVTGRATADGFRVQGVDGSALLPMDIRPTSYWRHDAMQQHRLLDTENGRVLAVTATEIGRQAGQEAPRVKYRLSGQLKHELTLSYEQDRLVGASLRKFGSDIEVRADDDVDAAQIDAATAAASTAAEGR